jgi:hypothetical protein
VVKKTAIVFILFALREGLAFSIDFGLLLDNGIEAENNYFSYTSAFVLWSSWSGAADWAAAKEGERIAKDTVISTGFKSSAILAVGNSTVIAQPLTRLSLAELLNQNETGTVSNRPVIVTVGHESWIDASTNSAVHPTTAAEITRNPVLPGQNARPNADNGVRLEAGGTLTMGVTFVKTTNRITRATQNAPYRYYH